MTPGIYPDLSMAEYLAIDALSASPVRAVVEQCPRAGWWESKLNPNQPSKVADILDLGTIAHSIFLEKSTANVVVINPSDYPTKSNGNVPTGWTNNEIRAARDAARAAGKSPILISEFAKVNAMVIEAEDFVSSLRDTEPAIWRAFQPDGGRSEVTIVWEDLAGLCKLRIDRASLDYGVVLNYKTSGQSVEPDRFGRSALAGMGYAFSAAWYRRGIRAATGIECDYVFLAQETDAPYLCSLVGVDPAWMALASAKVETGMRTWKRCLETGDWHGYLPRVYYPELPPWESSRGEAQISGIPYDIADLFERSDK